MILKDYWARANAGADRINRSGTHQTVQTDIRPAGKHTLLCVHRVEATPEHLNATIFDDMFQRRPDIRDERAREEYDRQMRESDLMQVCLSEGEYSLDGKPVPEINRNGRTIDGADEADALPDAGRPA